MAISNPSSFSSCSSSSSSSPYSSRNAPSPNSDKERQTLTTFMAMDILEAQVRENVKASSLKESEQIEYAKHVMRLESVSPFHCEAPSFTLELSSKERLLLNQTFQKWALNQDICLLELLGFDLFMHLEELLKYLPKHLSKEYSHKILDDFSGIFIAGYISFTAMKGEKGASKHIPTLHYFERGKGGDKFFQGITLNEWRLVHQDLKKKLETDFSESIKRSSAIKKHLMSACERLDLFNKLLLHPEASLFLFDFILSVLGEYFPESASLNNPSPHKTLDDLMNYTRFLSEGFLAGRKMGVIGCSSPIFIELHQRIKIFAQRVNRNKHAAIKALKGPAVELFSSLHNNRNFFLKNTMLAMNGELSHEAYCKLNGIAIMRKKSQEEFAEQMLHSAITVSLIAGFSQDWLDILDGQVIAPLLPDSCIPISRVYVRINHNLGGFFKSLEKKDHVMLIPPYPLPTSVTVKLSEVVSDVKQKLALYISEIAICPENVKILHESWIDLNSMIERNYAAWSPMMTNLNILFKNLDSLLVKLEKLRENYIKSIIAFLPIQEQMLHSQEWISYFTDTCLKECIDISRMAMIAKDAAACLQFHFDCSDEELLPDALIDFMTLEGLEELMLPIRQESIKRGAVLGTTRGMQEGIKARRGEETLKIVHEKMLTAPSKIATSSKDLIKTEEKAKPVSAKKMEKPLGLHAHKVISKSLPSLSSSPVTEEVSFIKIRKGAKKREILRMLRELGILPTRGHGSHKKLKSEGKAAATVATFPVGSLGASFPMGTARSISRQVNLHLEARGGGSEIKVST